jgi:hypothetical protein
MFARMGKKGQIFTIDLLISLSIFVLLFVSVVLFLYSVGDSANPYSTYSVQYDSNYVNNIATQAVDSLVGSTGYPSNWQTLTASCNSIYQIGLMYNAYELDPNKLSALTQLSDSCIASFLKSGGTFNVSVTFLNNTIFRISGTPITAGKPVAVNASYVSSIQRYVVLYPGSQILRVSFSEWIV